MNDAQSALIELCRLVKQLESRIITLEQTLLKPQPIPPPPTPTRSPIQIVKHEVCRDYGILIQTMISPTRQAGIVEARHVAMFICHKLLGLSSTTISCEFRRKDHSTALHAISSVADRVKTPSPFASRVIGLLESCRVRIQMAKDDADKFNRWTKTPVDAPSPV